MSLITRNNYEAYLLDYIEENLSPELIAELMLFFENNSDLKEELDAFEIHELVPLDIALLNKAELKRKEGVITSSNYEEFIIAEIEGENSTKISTLLHSFLEDNLEKKAVYKTYQKTKLVAANIIFKDKKSLKKKGGILIPIYWWYSSAAAVVIILFLVNGFNNKTQTYFPIADREEILPLKEETEVNLIFNEIEPEEKQLTVVKAENKKDVKEKSLKVKQKNSPSLASKEEFKNVVEKDDENSTKLADLSTQKNEAINDTSLIEEPKSNPEILIEKNLYANVKITYEKEKLSNGTPDLVKRKMTKLDVVRAAAKQQIKGNIGKGREKLLLALNTKPLNLFKKKNKN